MKLYSVHFNAYSERFESDEVVIFATRQEAEKYVADHNCQSSFFEDGDWSPHFTRCGKDHWESQWDEMWIEEHTIGRAKPIKLIPADDYALVAMDALASFQDNDILGMPPLDDLNRLLYIVGKETATIRVKVGDPAVIGRDLKRSLRALVKGGLVEHRLDGRYPAGVFIVTPAGKKKAAVVWKSVPEVEQRVMQGICNWLRGQDTEYVNAEIKDRYK